LVVATSLSLAVLEEKEKIRQRERANVERALAPFEVLNCRVEIGNELERPGLELEGSQDLDTGKMEQMRERR